MDTGITISIIAAISENGLIGKNNDIPWYLKDDLQHFAKITRDHVVIAGRITYESIVRRLGHPLLRRKIIVITRQSNYPVLEGCKTASSWAEAIELARQEGKEVFVIGGAKIYSVAIPYAKIMHLTKIHAQIQGDEFFPAYNKTEWQETSSEFHARNKNNEHDFTFVVLKRKKTEFVNLKNTRNQDQKEVMEKIQTQGFCPFCPEHYTKSELMPIIKEGKYWHIRKNRWPYKNTRVHLIVIHNAHVEKLSEINPDAAKELFELAKWIEDEYQILGGAIAVRFGDANLSGSTVCHIHFHLISPKQKNNGIAKTVNFPIG